MLFSQQDTGQVRWRVRPKERTQAPVTRRVQSEAQATGASYRKPILLPCPLGGRAGAGEGGGPQGGRGRGTVPRGGARAHRVKRVGPAPKRCA